ncbi:hypothetical protein RUND412_005033 [Rhizina undulata]
MFKATKSWTPKLIPDLTDRVIFVTGGNTGLGKESILNFVQKGATVYMASRTESKAEEAIKDIKVQVPDAKLSYIPLDLASFASIKSAVDIFTSKETNLHVLLNNAGVMGLPHSLTKEGYEIQFGTNHMGHFLLTKLLLPTLIKTAETAPQGQVRIVNVASHGHNIAFRGIPFDDMNMAGLTRTTLERYGISKTANILHARALNKRLNDKNILCVSLHPGVIASDLYTAFANQNPINKFNYKISKYFFTSVEKGAWNQLYCCTSEDLTMIDGGDYYVPVGTKGRGFIWGTSSYARDQDLAEKLWEWSEAEVAKHGY